MRASKESLDIQHTNLIYLFSHLTRSSQTFISISDDFFSLLFSSSSLLTSVINKTLFQLFCSPGSGWVHSFTRHSSSPSSGCQPSAPLSREAHRPFFFFLSFFLTITTFISFQHGYVELWEYSTVATTFRIMLSPLNTTNRQCATLNTIDKYTKSSSNELWSKPERQRCSSQVPPILRLVSSTCSLSSRGQRCFWAWTIKRSR